MAAPELDGATALVTGASSGIGAATAVALADAGARLWLVGRDEHRLAAVAARTDGTAVVADLADPDGPARVVRALSGLDVGVLVHAAGRGWAGPVARMPAATLRELIMVDLLAPLELTRLLLPGMLAAGAGSIVFVSSIAGVVGVPEEAGYAAAKAGLLGFADSLRQEVGPCGPQVSVIIPGAVATSFFEHRGRAYDRRVPRQLPAGRVAQATVRAIRTGRAEVHVPAWLGLASRMHGAAPGTYRRLARRWG